MHFKFKSLMDGKAIPIKNRQNVKEKLKKIPTQENCQKNYRAKERRIIIFPYNFKLLYSGFRLNKY